ncbi:MAG: hypothetical protein JJU10_03845 [Idiomarina sp.]|nr:hypothetical protein [Idiomarina sp.]
MNKSWNIASTRINPLVVFLVCASLTVLNGVGQRWGYVLPLALLAVNAGFSFAFWSWRLKKSRGKRWLTVSLVLGKGSRVVAIVSIFVLAAALAAAVASPSWVEVHFGKLDTKFWILWVWAVLEVVHSHVYRLTLGMRNTLEEVVANRRWSEAGAPLGGAIGGQLRKLRHRCAGSFSRRIGA